MTAWILETIAAGGYWGIVFLMAIENIFPPIPSELIMGLGGVNVARGDMSFWPLLFAGTVGSTGGNYVWFLIGKRLGYERLKPIVDRWGRWLTLDWQDVERIIAFFQRHGHWVVFAVRFSPFFRSMISLPAGLAHMRHAKFLIYTAAGAAIWNILLISGGYYIGQNFHEELERYTGPAVIITVIGFVSAYLWRVIRWQPRP
jgi:membrane protein DedA with SNARE-associated domain